MLVSTRCCSVAVWAQWQRPQELAAAGGTCSGLEVLEPSHQQVNGTNLASHHDMSRQDSSFLLCNCQQVCVVFFLTVGRFASDQYVKKGVRDVLAGLLSTS